MIVKRDFIYKTLLLLLFFVPMVFRSVEVTMMYCVFATGVMLMDTRFKFTNGIINAVLPLLIVLFVAFVSMFFYEQDGYDILKDVVFMLRPILMIVLGYYLVAKIENKDFIFNAIIYVAIAFALYHMYRVFKLLLNFQFGIAMIRHVGGKANYIELIALVLLLVGKKTRPFKLPTKYLFIVRWILILSFVLYFSRTMLVAVFILGFAIKGYTKLTRKGIIFLSIFLTVGGIGFASLQSMELDRSSTGVEGFLYKIQNAASEILETDVDVENHKDLWDHWRGYEASRAFKHLSDTKHNVGYVSGKGLGSLIDLGFVAPLNADGIQYIPVIHNGFAYILFKSGFIGVFVYLLFLLSLYLQAYQTKWNKEVVFFNNALSGLALFYFATTLIITGIYNQGDVVSIALGAFIYLKYYHKKKAQLE